MMVPNMCLRIPPWLEPGDNMGERHDALALVGRAHKASAGLQGRLVCNQRAKPKRCKEVVVAELFAIVEVEAAVEPEIAGSVQRELGRPHGTVVNENRSPDFAVLDRDRPPG